MSDSRLEKFIYALCSMDVSDLPVPLSRIEKLWNCLITGETPDFEPQSRNEKYLMAMLDRYDISNLPAPMSRGEKLLYKIAVGETDLSDVPGYLSRYEELLKYLIENGLSEDDFEDDFEYVLYTLNQSLHTLYLTAEKPVKKAIVYGDTLVNTLQESSSLSVTPMGEAIDTQQATITGTANGVIKSAILKGNTLDSLVDFKDSFSVNNNAIDFDFLFKNKIDLAYTLVINITEATSRLGASDYIEVRGVREDNTVVNIKRLTQEFAVGTYSIDFTFNEVFSRFRLAVSFNCVANAKLKGELYSVKMPVLTTCGKNLCDNSKNKAIEINSTTGAESASSNNVIVSDYIEINPLKTYTASKVTSLGLGSISFRYYNSKKEYIGINKTNEAKYVRLRQTNQNGSLNLDDILFQLEEGSTATTYEPFKSNILTVNEPIELHGIGEGSNRVEDELDCLTGEVTERVGTLYLANEYEGIDFDLSKGSTVFISLGVKADEIVDYSPILSNTFETKNVFNLDEEGILYDGFGLYARVLKSRITELTNDSIVQYLKATQSMVFYRKKVESVKTVDLTVVDQDGNTVPHLQAFNETTHISTSSTGLFPNVVIPATVSYPSIIKPSTLYTVKLKRSVTSGTLMINVGGTEQAVTSDCFTMTTPSTLTSQDVIFSGKGNVISEVTVVEDDQTSKEYGYFEGMQSVKMPVLTTTGKNIFSPTKMIINDGATYGYYKHKDDESVRCTLSISDKDTSVDISGIYFGMSKSGKNANDGIEWLISNGSVTQPNTLSFTTNRNFISIYPNNTETLNKLTKRFNIQLEYGEVKTTYEPYKSNILSTPSDLELRGIGEGSSRVEDELDLLTGEVVERIGEIVLDGSENWLWTYDTSDTRYSIYRTTLSDVDTTIQNNVLNCLSDKAKTDSWRNINVNFTDKTFGLLSNQQLRVQFNGTLEELKMWLSETQPTIQYLKQKSIKTVDLTVVNQDNQPTELGTFENITHVSLEAENLIPEVEMEVATNLLEDTVFNLTDAFNTLYPTAAKPVVDGMLYGQTLVNLATQKSGRFNGTRFLRIPLRYTLNSNTNYFVNFIVKESTLTDGVTCRFKNTSTGITLGALKSSGIIAVNTNVPDILEIYIVNTDDVTNGLDAIIDDIMVIEYQEGMENWDIPYFDGVQSVKMPVLMTTGKNIMRSLLKIGSLSNNGVESDEQNRILTEDFIDVSRLDLYTISSNHKIRLVYFYDNNKKFIRQFYSSDGVDTYTSSKANKESYIKIIAMKSDNSNFTTNDLLEFQLMIEQGSVATSYEPNKSNILTVNEDVELRGDVYVNGQPKEDILDLLSGECSISVGESVLNGNENWSEWYHTGTLLRFMTDCSNMSDLTNIKLQCDKIPSYGYNQDAEGLYGNGGKLYLIIDNSDNKLLGNTVNDLKAYLSQNPITIQYPLKEKLIKTVDLTVVDQDGNSTTLETFDDTTHVLLNSEGLVPEATLTVRTKIPSASSTSLLMDDISTKQERLNTTIDEQSENVDATMIATTEIFEEIL